MDGKLTLEIVVPQRRVLREEVDEVSAPGEMGYFGALPGHTPFLTLLKTGEIGYRIGGQRYYLAAGVGYAEVGPDKVTILAEAAERAENIDVERARRAVERANGRLRQRESEDIDVPRAQAALLRAQTRLQVASRVGR